VSPFVYLRL